MWWFLGAACMALFFFLVLHILYYAVFCRNKMTILDDRTLPEGEQYEPYHEGILKGIEKMLPEPFEEIRISSYDGLQLYGRHYQMYEDAPVVIFFHGYRSSSVRDGNGLFDLCKRCGYNILMTDQRAHGKSEGKLITFGIRERRDVLSWIDYVLERCGKKTPILLTGISMGAATILMASNLNLPDNVKGIIADCPYSAPKDILKSVMKSLKLPAGFFYVLTKWSARIFGGLNLEEITAKEAVEESTVPILFVHGDDDRLVPCQMSQECYDACASEKRIVFVKDAGHGLSFCVDAKRYEKEVLEFMQRVLGTDSIIYIPEQIKEIIRDETYEVDSVGMSASTVIMFADKVLKISEAGEDADREHQILQWLKGKIPVPKVIYYLVEENKSYLLMSRMAGEMSCDDSYMSRPEVLIDILSEGLKDLWQIDISNCPIRADLDQKLLMARYNVEHGLVDVNNTDPETFGEGGFRDPQDLLDWLERNRPEEEIVFSHGDYCLPNIFAKEGQFTGFIDLGRGGMADKWQDIALCYRSLMHNADGSYGGKKYAGYEDAPEKLFQALGIQPDWEKIRYYMLLDELF